MRTPPCRYGRKPTTDRTTSASARRGATSSGTAPPRRAARSELAPAAAPIAARSKVRRAVIATSRPSERRPNGLGLRVELQDRGAHLSAPPRLLHPAERSGAVETVPEV